MIDMLAQTVGHGEVLITSFHGIFKNFGRLVMPCLQSHVNPWALCEYSTHFLLFPHKLTDFKNYSFVTAEAKRLDLMWFSPDQNAVC